MFKKASLKAKLLSAFSLFALLIGIVGGVNYKGITEVFVKFDHIAEVNLPNASILGEMRFLVSEISRDMLRITLQSATKVSYEEAINDLNKAIADYEKSSKTYESIPFVEGEAELYDNVVKAYKPLIATANQHVQMIRSTSNPELKYFFEKYQSEFAPKKEELDRQILSLIEFQNAEAKAWSNQADDVSMLYRQLSLGLVISSFALALGLGGVISWSLSNKLNNINSLTLHSTNEVTTASKQLSSASHGLSGAATQVASSLQETAASIEELGSMVKQGSENAMAASDLSGQGRQSAEKVASNMNTLLASIERMSDKSRKVAEIVTLIDDIAFQTNILSLNAAVEAARAGDAGKGFAVVADAVRNLAQKSAEASKKITVLVNSTLESANESEKIAEESNRSLTEIVEMVKKIANINAELAASSKEQHLALSQISKAMGEIDQATQQNAAVSEQVAASSEEMSSQAISMMGVVEELNVVVRGHGKSNELLVS